MPKTPLMMEFQITKEYLGFATHLAYLGPMYEEALQADTWRRARLDRQGGRWPGLRPRPDRHGRRRQHRQDRNWSGSQFDQANWYVFGRMAWDPEHRPRPRRSPRNGRA
jgi:alpha-glucuronidase